MEEPFEESGAELVVLLKVGDEQAPQSVHSRRGNHILRPQPLTSAIAFVSNEGFGD